MIDLEMLENDDAKPVSRDGLLDFEIINGTQVTSQIVDVRLRTQLNPRFEIGQPLNTMDWISLRSELAGTNRESYAAIAFTMLENLVLVSDGVTSVDNDNITFEVDSNKLSLTGLCFTHECGDIEEISL